MFNKLAYLPTVVDELPSRFEEAATDDVDVDPGDDRQDAVTE